MPVINIKKFLIGKNGKKTENGRKCLEKTIAPKVVHARLGNVDFSAPNNPQKPTRIIAARVISKSSDPYDNNFETLWDREYSSFHPDSKLGFLGLFDPRAFRK